MRIKFVIFLFCLMLPSLMLANGDKDTIKGMVAEFIQAGDDQNGAMAGKVLHPTSTHHVPGKNFENGILVVSTEQYVAMLDAKKIGGYPRQTDIKSIDLGKWNRSAMVTLELDSDKMKFHQFIGFAKVNDEWKIVSVLTAATPVKQNG